MRRQTEPPEKMRLFPLHPWWLLLIFAALLSPIVLIVLLNRWPASSRPLLMLCGGILLFGMAVVWLEYFRCHVSADAEGITMIRWRRVTHIKWDQVVGCEFNSRSPSNLICQCGEEVCRVPCALTSRHRRFLRQYASKSVIPP